MFHTYDLCIRHKYFCQRFSRVSIGYALLRKHFPSEALQQITHHPKAVTETSYRLLFSKKVESHAAQLSTFNEGLKKLQESGKFDRYLQDALEGKYDR